MKTNIDIVKFSSFEGYGVRITDKFLLKNIISFIDNSPNETNGIISTWYLWNKIEHVKKYCTFSTYENALEAKLKYEKLLKQNDTKIEYKVLT